MKSFSATSWGFIAAGVLILLGTDLWIATESRTSALELAVSKSTVSSRFQIFFDTGKGYQESESAVAAIASGSEPQHLFFPLPEQPVKSIRLDPLATAGSVIISEAKITRSSPGEAAVQLDLKRVLPTYEIEHLAFQASTGSLEITTTASSVDPQCQFTFDRPFVADQRTGQSLFFYLLSIDVSILLIYALLTGVIWVVTGQSPVEWWQSVQTVDKATYRLFSRISFCASIPLACYGWLLIIDMGRSPLVPEQEPSWVAVLTYAVAMKWQFGKDIVLTYGPTGPLMISAFIGSIDTFVFLGRLACEAWALGLMFWLGSQLSLGRRWFFWVATVTLAAACLSQPFFYFSIVAAGLLLLSDSRFKRWLSIPTLVYLAAISLAKVSFLVFTVLMLAMVTSEQARRRNWFGALVPGISFVLCLLVEWCLLGQNLANLPHFLQGYLEMAGGFSQAMSLPPDPRILSRSLWMALASIAQIVFLWRGQGSERRAKAPIIGLLTGALLLAWKAGFARADGHVADWLVYSMISAAAAPAFFPTARRTLYPWFERICLAGLFIAGMMSLSILNPSQEDKIAPMFRDRWRGTLQAISHPREVARANKRAIEANRATYALPKIRDLVGQHRVDVFCDEGAIAILNGLNYKPRPSFLSYSTYTPWLMDLDVAYYLSPGSPEYVLFKLQSIDHRLPTLQNAPLLIVLAQFYEKVLSEGGYELFRRREQPNLSKLPTAFPLLLEGDTAFDESLALPSTGPIWCQLTLRETLTGKLLKFFYQQPPLNLEITYQGGRVDSFRMVPQLGAAGFLLNPLPASTEQYMLWIEGKPLEEVTSIRFAATSALTSVFQPHVHYRFYRVPAPYRPAH